MLRSKLPAGFVVPAQSVEAPPCGADWVHGIKHGYRMIVRALANAFGFTAARQSIGRRGCRRSQKAQDG
jgi:hypothetical protein